MFLLKIKGEGEGGHFALSGYGSGWTRSFQMALSWQAVASISLSLFLHWLANPKTQAKHVLMQDCLNSGATKQDPLGYSQHLSFSPKIIRNFKHHKKWNYSKVSKGAKIRNRYNQVPHLTQDTNAWENNKLTVIHHKREPRGQPFPSRWPHGTNKQTHTKA